MKTQLTKFKLGLMLLFAGGLSAQAQYNVDYKMGKYIDPQTLESNVDIGDQELITVGTLTVNDFSGSHQDIVLTRLNKDGKVVWNNRYGLRDLNEFGNGITLSWDKRHVIIVGNVHKRTDEISTRPVNQAIVLKVRISDGAVVWTTYHGIRDYDDRALLVKRNNTLEDDESYVVVGASRGESEESYERMYAFKIKDNGNQIWSRRYYLGYNFPISSMRPSSMVENGNGKFMIAGTRSEINRPTRIFTVGINALDGDVSDHITYYPISVIKRASTVDIDREPEGKGYAITFTAHDFRGECLSSDADALSLINNRIGVLRLDEYRKVKWSNVYWEKRATDHNGLSIRFYKDELHVCANINREERYNTSALLRVKESNGAVISCITHQVPEFLTDYGPLTNHMIRRNDNKEYYIKSIYPKWGFSMVNTSLKGASDCDDPTRIRLCAFRTDLKKERSKAVEYGKYDFVDIRRYRVDFGTDPCEDLRIGLAETTNGGNLTGTSSLTRATVYPSPVNADQAIVTLQFVSELETQPGTIRVFNSMGQEVFTRDLQLNEGQNKFEFQVSDFTKGIYLVTISSQDQLIDRVKFVKN